MPTHSLVELPIQKLKRAVALREQIETLKAELGNLLPSTVSRANGHRNGYTNGHFHRGRADLNGNGTSHGLSVAGRARIAAAQRLRWSKYRVTHTTRATSASSEPRLSAEGRAKVSAAVRARWERFRANKARALRAK